MRKGLWGREWDWRRTEPRIWTKICHISCCLIYMERSFLSSVSRAMRDATPKWGTRGVAWDFESVRTRKLEKSVRIFWRHFPKDISINEKMKNTRSSYNTTNAFYQKNLPISQVRTCVFAKRTPRLWYFVCFCTLLFSCKISRFSLCSPTISCHSYNMRSVSKPLFA